jgi:hypothetical protein
VDRQDVWKQIKAEGEEDPFFRLIARFAIDFENTYLRWLYETLAFLEENEP